MMLCYSSLQLTNTFKTCTKHLAQWSITPGHWWSMTRLFFGLTRLPCSQIDKTFYQSINFINPARADLWWGVNLASVRWVGQLAYVWWGANPAFVRQGAHFACIRWGANLASVRWSANLACVI